MQKFSFDFFWEGYVETMLGGKMFLPPTCERYLIREGEEIDTEWESGRCVPLQIPERKVFPFGKCLVKGDNTGGTKCGKAEQR